MNVIFGKDEEIQETYDTHEKNMTNGVKCAKKF